MRFTYLTRQFNRSGYYILEHLIKVRRNEIAAVIVPKLVKPSWFDQPFLAPAAKVAYALETKFYRCAPLRFTGSVKSLCRRHGIPLLEWTSIKSDDSYAVMKRLSSDLLVLGGGWPELLPQRVFDLHPLGAINAHPSLLPEFRGTDIHRWQINKGAPVSGVTIHYMEETFDTGEILGQVKIDVKSDDAPQMLFERTARSAAPLMEEVLQNIENSAPARVSGKAQIGRLDDSKYHSKWRWNDASFMTLDWHKPAVELERFIRACTQESYKYRGPFFSVGNTHIIVRKASCYETDTRGRVGEVYNIDTRGVGIRCGADGKSILQLEQVQKGSNWLALQRGIWADGLIRKTGLKIGDVLSLNLGD